MALPKKKYIQNCTGSNLSGSGNHEKREIISRSFSRVIFYVLMVAFFVVTGYVLFFSTYLRISKIVVSGNTELTSEEVSAVVERKQQGNFFKVIPGNDFLLTNEGDIKQLLLNEFRKIKDVSVVKKFPDMLEIDLQERKALLVLCSGEKCFLIDENGAAYNEADFNSPEIVQNHLIKISDQSTRNIAVGDIVMDKAYVQYVSSLKESLQRIGVDIEDELWTPSLMADEINAKMSQGGELFFSTEFSMENSIKSLDIVLKRDPLKSLQNDLAYVDLRTENKIFYKINNSAPRSMESSDNKETGNVSKQ